MVATRRHSRIANKNHSPSKIGTACAIDETTTQSFQGCCAIKAAQQPWNSNVGATIDRELVTSMLMPHQAITVGGIGHRDLEALVEFPYVQLCFHRVLTELVRRFPRLKAVSALATGADTVFAQCAKSLSIPLESVIPFANFETDFADPETDARCRSLRAGAIYEHRLNFSERDDRAYKKSMEWVVFKSNIVVAAWDGRRAGSPGGTWEAISLCEKLGKTLIHVDTVNKTVKLRVGLSGTPATLKEVSVSQIMRRL